MPKSDAYCKLEAKTLSSVGRTINKSFVTDQHYLFISSIYILPFTPKREPKTEEMWSGGPQGGVGVGREQLFFEKQLTYEGFSTLHGGPVTFLTLK